MGTMNPKIQEIEVGVRELQKIKIYPLSVKDQLDLTDTILLIVNDVMADEADSPNVDIDTVDTNLIEKAVKAITDNLAAIVNYVVDKPAIEGNKDIMELITNDQLLEIANIIFDVNYADFLKNSKALVQKARAIWEVPEKKGQMEMEKNTEVPSESSLKSVENILDTD